MVVDPQVSSFLFDFLVCSSIQQKTWQQQMVFAILDCCCSERSFMEQDREKQNKTGKDVSSFSAVLCPAISTEAYYENSA
jgi:hypothetical protein